MHTVRLLLNTTKYDESIMERRFYAVSHIHNVLVKHSKKLLKKLRFDRDYQAYKEEYILLLKKSSPSNEDIVRKRVLSANMAAIMKDIGLTEYALQSYIKVCGRQYKKLLSSQQIQKEATRVYRGVEKVLFSDGKDIHFKKCSDITTISGKTNTNGVKFDKESLSVDWLGLHINCSRVKKQATVRYIAETLKNDVSYCEIERKMFPDGWHYYVIVYLKGIAPKKIENTGIGTAGIDIGTSTIAVVSDKSVMLKELAPECRKYNKKIESISRHMDFSRRISNPNKYNADGTIKKGNRDKWVYSGVYLKNQRKLKSLYRQKAAYIKQSHEEMINDLLRESNCFITENMSFRSLQKKAKSTEWANEPVNIKQKDGTVKSVYKYKRKKRFGRSLNNRAPSVFITIMKRKAEQYSGAVFEVNTKEFKASQYNHYTDKYEKHTLKERSKTINGCYVQRDLYSAFLLKNAEASLNKPDREKCSNEFVSFLKMQDNLISEMKHDNISMKQCFGF